MVIQFPILPLTQSIDKHCCWKTFSCDLSKRQASDVHSIIGNNVFRPPGRILEVSCIDGDDNLDIGRTLTISE